MRILKIDEYLIVNLHTGKKRWLNSIPRTMSTYEVAVRIKGTVKLPDWLPLIDLGEITIPEVEAKANAEMG